VNKKVATSVGLALINLRYIPKSQIKDGESLFSKCTISKDMTKIDIKRNEINWTVLRGNGMLPVHKAHWQID